MNSETVIAPTDPGSFKANKIPVLTRKSRIKVLPITKKIHLIDKNFLLAMEKSDLSDKVSPAL